MLWWNELPTGSPIGPKKVEPPTKPDWYSVEFPPEPMAFEPLNWWHPVQDTPSAPPAELSRGRLVEVESDAAVGEWQLTQKRSGSGLGWPANATVVTSLFSTIVVGVVSARECIDCDHCW